MAAEEHTRTGAPLGRASLVLGVIWLAAFFPVVSGSRSFFSFDLFYEHLPVWHEVQSNLLAGQSPFWLDGLFMGHSLLFTQEAPLFYPLMAPILLTGAEVHRLADLFSLVHLWLAGVTAFALAWRLTRTWPASVFGAVAWMLSARTVQSVMWPNAVAVASLVPLVVLGLIRLREPGRAGVALVSLGLGLSLLASRPQSLLGIAPALVAAVLVLGWRRKGYFGALALSLVLGAAIGAPALLPSALLFPESSRFGGLSLVARNDGALSAKELDQVFLPVDGIARWTEPASYPGVLVLILFLAGFALLSRPALSSWRFLYLGLALAGLVGFAFAWGEAGPYGLLAELPLLRGFRTPVRYLATLSLALVVGSSLVVAHLAKVSRRGALLAWAATAVLTLDLTAHARYAAPTVPELVHRVRPAIVDYLGNLPPDPLGFRPRLWSFGYFTPFHLIRDAERAGAATRDQLAYARGGRFGLLSVQGAGPPMARVERLLESRSLRVAELGGVATLILRDRVPGLRPDAAAPPLPHGHVHQIEQPFPRLIVVPSVVTAEPDRVLEVLLSAGFDPRREVLLEEDTRWETGHGWGPGDASLLVRSRTSSTLEIDVALPGPGHLVVFDAWSPGWTALVDGREVGVLRANYCFRAVPLQGGAHRVKFVFVPPGVREGVLLCAAGLFGLILVILQKESGTGRSPAQ